MVPQQYEADFLKCYAQGIITLGQVMEQLDIRMQHVLYRSTVWHLLGLAQLSQPLEQARSYNEQQLNGLLCYSSEGHFTQVIRRPRNGS